MDNPPAAAHPHAPGSMALLDLVLERYLKAGRKLIAIRPQIEALEDPRLQLTLTPLRTAGGRRGRTAGEFLACGRRLHRARRASRTAFPLLGDIPAPVRWPSTHSAWHGRTSAGRLAAC